MLGPKEAHGGELPKYHIEAVYDNLINNEGVSGDTTGAAPTRELGVTPAAEKAVKGSKNMTGQQIALEYIKLQDGELDKIKGYKDAPIDVKEAILDTAYNTSAGAIKKWSTFKKHLANGDYIPALKETLDTSNIKGKSSKGIAARRARNYNKVAQIPISTVEQKTDGTIIYRDSTGKTIFSYKKPRHPSSEPGVVRVQ